MAITVGIDENGRVTILDSTNGVLYSKAPPAGATVTEFNLGQIDMADNDVATAVPFGGVATAKVLVFWTDNDQPIDINLTPSASIRVKDFAMIVDTGTGYTAATLDNDVSGTATVTVNYLVAG